MIKSSAQHKPRERPQVFGNPVWRNLQTKRPDQYLALCALREDLAKGDKR